MRQVLRLSAIQKWTFPLSLANLLHAPLLELLQLLPPGLLPGMVTTTLRTAHLERTLSWLSLSVFPLREPAVSAGIPVLQPCKPLTRYWQARDDVWVTCAVVGARLHWQDWCHCRLGVGTGQPPPATRKSARERRWLGPLSFLSYVFLRPGLLITAPRPLVGLLRFVNRFKCCLWSL